MSTTWPQVSSSNVSGDLLIPPHNVWPQVSSSNVSGDLLIPPHDAWPQVSSSNVSELSNQAVLSAEMIREQRDAEAEKNCGRASFYF